VKINNGITRTVAKKAGLFIILKRVGKAFLMKIMRNFL